MGEGSGRITKQERTLDRRNESTESIHIKQKQFDFSNKRAFSKVHWPVADPGFARGGGANPPEGRQHTLLPNIPKNCVKLKEFGPGGRPSHPL